MRKLFNSLSKFFKGKRNNREILQETLVPQEETTLQPLQKSPASQVRKTREKNRIEELRIEAEPVEEKEKKQTPPSEIVRSEVNLLNLPFFALSTKGLENMTKTEYRSTIQREDKKLEILWKVSSNPEYGYPGPFDKKVYKAIEHIVSELRSPIQNPIRIGSLYNLIKLTGLKSDPGWAYRQIESALDRMVATTIESSGTFYNKSRSEWIKDKFHLYDRVVLKGKKFPNGEIADSNYLFLNSWYLESLNARYVKPIDWSYYCSLRNSISCRLYELLGIKFYGVGSQGFIRYKYSTLCQLLPITRQQYLSKAKEILNPSHEELRRTAFLKDYCQS
jgi:hypothetical protein